jgi:hypothetical protein
VFFGPFSGDLDPLDADASLPNEVGRAGDVDGDGQQDFALLSADGVLHLFAGAGLFGGVSLGAEDATWTVSGGSTWAEHFAGGDLDQDGHDEVWVGHRYDPSRLDVFSGADLDGRVFGAADRDFPLDQAVPPVLGDFDGDGENDLVLRPTGPPWELHLYLGATNGAAAPMRIGDLDGDGVDDLVIAEQNYL